MRVLSFDVGLRNLAAAVISRKKGWVFPEEYRKYAHEEESIDEFKARAMLHFLQNGWELEQWRVMDVTDTLDKEIKNVKRLGMVKKGVALTDTLASLEEEWFPAEAPDVIVVEIQHNANADMRAVSMGIIVFFRRSMPDTILEGKSGSHKLKLCTALGFKEGDGLATIKRRKRKGPVAEDEDDDTMPDPDDLHPKRKVGWKRAGPRWVRAGSGKAKDKYDDNKRRAILAMKKLLEPMALDKHVALSKQKKSDDLGDALLQGLWVMWTKIAPRAPPRRRKKKTTGPK